MADHPSPDANAELSPATVVARAAAESVSDPVARDAPNAAPATNPITKTVLSTGTSTVLIGGSEAAKAPMAAKPVPSDAAASGAKPATAAGPATAAKPAAKQPDSPAAEKSSPQPSLIDRPSRFAWVTVLPSWFASLTLHMVMLIALALIVEQSKPKQQVVDLVATDSESHIGSLEESAAPDLPQAPIEADQTDGLAEALVLSSEANGSDITTLNELPAAASGIGALSNFGLEAAPVLDMGKALGGGPGGGLTGGQGFDGRGDAARKALAMERGGSPGSENAVGLALAWLAHHQNPDGSWSFDHRKGPCQGRCTNPGKMERGDIAATAIALLPFLGAGQTHIEGKYKKNVQAGLYYLINRMKITKDGGDLSYEQGVMYGHGLASIALCEAYGMTKDTGLAEPAQQAVNFIVYAQDPNGGGWRYTPHQPGDTSVVGWQLMALKSAHMAYLNVPPKTIKGVVNFLNSVQKDSGAFYGYVSPGRGEATTAIGLLCRMYLGWKHDEPALGRGVEFLSDRGPMQNNMYYNYYATQVLHHYEGPEWKKWNDKMRDYLVEAQARSGHEQGSWFFGGDDASAQGGRVYTTAMCAMTLEVYYRHLPIYRKDSTTSDFDE